MSVGNKSGDDYKLVCISCGGDATLSQIAHRNTLGEITGYVFSCTDCMDAVQGSDYSWKPKDS